MRYEMKLGTKCKDAYRLTVLGCYGGGEEAKECSRAATTRGASMLIILLIAMMKHSITS